MYSDDTLTALKPVSLGDRLIEDLGDLLHLEVVIA